MENVILLLTLLAAGLATSCPRANHCEYDVCDSNTGFCIHGCKKSWNGPRCDTQTVCPNCQLGYCNAARVCLRGCHSGFYGDTCNKTCHAHCKNKCDFKTGVCLGGCKLGWYGPYCTRKCGGGSVQDSCYRWHGTCQCQSGWYAERCSQECFGCLDRACDHLSGRCRRGCKPGWSGIKCSTNICRNCVNSACTSWTSGSRCHGCVSGYHGQTCAEKCADNCAVCSQFANLCSQCKQGSLCITTPTTFASNNVSASGDFSINTTVTSEGWTSVFNTDRLIVVQNSSNHCEYDVCDSNTGFCIHGCKKSWNGPRCDTQTVCPNCQLGYCNAARVCLRGCHSGFYGDTCNKTCHAHCKNKCDFKTGVCLGGCKLGWYGPYCTRKCGGGSVQDSCYRWHGTCQCQSGWYAERCSQECFGCLDRACDHLSGRCRRGCKPGWSGIKCSTNICRNCVDSACTSWTSGSRCHGCVSGYRGQTCEDKCTYNCAVCSQFGNVCSQCKQGLFCITTPTTFASNNVSASGDFSINTTVTSEGWTSVFNTDRIIVVQNSANGWKTYSSSGVRRMSFIFACVLLAFAVFLTAWCARETWRQRKPKTGTGLDTWNVSAGNVPRHSQSGVTELQEADHYYDGFRTRPDSRNHHQSRQYDSHVGYEFLRYTTDGSDSVSSC